MARQDGSGGRQRMTDRLADRLAGATGGDDTPTQQYSVHDDFEQPDVFAAPTRRERRQHRTSEKLQDRFAPGEELAFVRHQHEVVMLVPMLRTAVGLLALAVPDIALPCLGIFAVLALLSVRQFIRAYRPSLIVVAVLVVIGLIFGRRDSGAPSQVTLAVLLVLWLLSDLVEWRNESLVVTTQRVYKFYGIFIQHSPSVALTGVAYIDPELPPMGRLFGYGTLNLDSAAQRDQPLSTFPYLPDVLDVQRRILELRTSANRRMYAGRNGPGQAAADRRQREDDER
jgi:membrane protein YdbS with pleckstrin-like domain